ncbi:MAG: enoyl-CoA hydratase-related protein [SAR202 cluster bacterium]|jgi:enoyl-CoA hydratase/carnithine racemase|nr:enoyl-CoA hydratase-related protein [SAR202 cluster bacterium]
MTYKHVLYRKEGHIAFVTINRPHAMNAVSYDANAEMYDVWTDFNDDPEMWVAVLTGAGDRAFCAGSDIKDMVNRPPDLAKITGGQREAKDSPLQEGGLVHREIWKPIIAAVNGYCLGGGLEIAMACDIIIAAESARFGVPEIRNVGAYPGSGGIHRLPRHIPMKAAMRMLLTGEHITATEALGFGLINQIVPDANLMEEATALANKINENSPIAARVTKEIVARSVDLPMEYPATEGRNAWDLDDIVSAKLRESEDYKSQEGPRAFVEKRKPVWTGR